MSNKKIKPGDLIRYKQSKVGVWASRHKPRKGDIGLVLNMHTVDRNFLDLVVFIENKVTILLEEEYEKVF